MKKLNMDQLILLSEEKAVRKHFDMHNSKWCGRLLVVFFVYGVVMVSVHQAEPMPSLSGFITIGLSLTAFFMARLAMVERYFYSFCLWYLVFQFLALSLPPYSWTNENYWVFIFPYLLLLFRLRVVGYLFLYGIILGITLWQAISLDEDLITRTAAGVAIFVVCLPISLVSSARKKGFFLEEWTLARQNKDRLRMKKELEHAREIQLSFLPASDPGWPELDLSCAMEPATEVGGDYYDYFRLSNQRTALIIGDVSGHGVASALVLSGVRSCLYLLRDTLSGPKETLVKLNRVLKETTDKRTFMTMLSLVIDTGAQEVIFANAGHTPMYHYQAKTGQLHQVRRPSLPLGAIREPEYAEERMSFEPGDTLVLYSDGLTEARAGGLTGAVESMGDDYGESRFEARIRNLASSQLASHYIRDRLLGDVALFTGEEEQLDDITLVVARFPH